MLPEQVRGGARRRLQIVLACKDTQPAGYHSFCCRRPTPRTPFLHIPHTHTTLQCAHFAAFHRLPSRPSRVVEQRPSRAYIGQFTPDGNIFIGRLRTLAPPLPVSRSSNVVAAPPLPTLQTTCSQPLK